MDASASRHEQINCDSDLGHQLGVLSGEALFGKTPSTDTCDRLRDQIADLWTGSGKQMEKAFAAAKKDDGDGYYKFVLEAENDFVHADIVNELPQDLADALAKNDLAISRKYEDCQPTRDWIFKLKFWQTRDRIYRKLVKERLEQRKRGREREEPKEEDLNEEVKEEPSQEANEEQPLTNEAKRKRPCTIQAIFTINTEEDIGWNTVDANTQMVEVWTAENVKLQLYPTANQRKYELHQVKCTPEQMAEGW